MKTVEKSVNQYLTMLEAYGARIEEVEPRGLIEGLVEATGTDAAVLGGKVEIMRALVERHNQGDIPIIREVGPDKYEVLKGEVIIRAVDDLGYTKMTAVLINCEDDDVEAIKKMSSVNDTPYPISLVMDRLPDVKQLVKAKLVEQKKAGLIDSYETNKALEEATGVSSTYLKKLASRMNDADDEIVVEDGATYNSILNPRIVKTPNEKVATSVKLHCVRDHEKKEDGLCADCPSRETYQKLLHALQEVHDYQIHLQLNNKAA